MSGKKHFLNARRGQFSEIPEDGQIKFSTDEITGRIVHVEFKDTKAGETLRIHIVNEENFYVISMFTNAPIYCQLVRALKVSNILRDVTLRMHNHDGADQITVSQMGTQIIPNLDITPFSVFILEQFQPALRKMRNPYPNHAIYRPYGSKNSIQGGYFTDTPENVGRHQPVENRFSFRNPSSRTR